MALAESSFKEMTLPEYFKEKRQENYSKEGGEVLPWQDKETYLLLKVLKKHKEDI